MEDELGQISPDVQRIIEQVAILERQKRLTPGQSLMLQSNALRQAGNIKGADVLKQAAFSANLEMQAERSRRAYEMAMGQLEAQRNANALAALSNAIGTGMVGYAGLDKKKKKTIEEVAQELGQPVQGDVTAPMTDRFRAAGMDLMVPQMSAEYENFLADKFREKLQQEAFGRLQAGDDARAYLEEMRLRSMGQPTDNLGVASGFIPFGGM